MGSASISVTGHAVAAAVSRPAAEARRPGGSRRWHEPLGLAVDHRHLLPISATDPISH
jgi:hypothetical protein